MPKHFQLSTHSNKIAMRSGLGVAECSLDCKFRAIKACSAKQQNINPIIFYGIRLQYFARDTAYKIRRILRAMDLMILPLMIANANHLKATNVIGQIYTMSLADSCEFDFEI